MEKLGYFVQYTPLKVMLIGSLLSCLLAVGIEVYDTGSFAGATFSLVFFLSFISINFILSILSFSIYFNIYKPVRDNPLLSFLSFFFPVIAVGVALLITDINIIINEDFFYSLLIISPFLIPQTFFFIRFRTMVKRGDFNISEDEDEND